MHQQNKHVILRSRPGVNGEPKESNFAVEPCPYPPSEPFDKYVLVRTLYIAMDAALRCRMNEDTGVDYLGPWTIDAVVDGFSGVGVVEESRYAELCKGDIVYRAMSWPWQIWFSTEGDSLRKVEMKDIAGDLTAPLSYMGLSGLTALLGLREKGGIQRGTGQTCVVSAAAGACGILAGQIAKLEGCGRVVGICGSDEKCKVLTESFNFDAAINYKTQNVEEKLKETCPKGVQVYFDNVGGTVSNQVIRQMTPHSNIVLSGQISMYNTDQPYPPPLPPDVQKILDSRDIRRERFLVLRYQQEFEAAILQLAAWARAGQLIPKVTIEEGIENAPKAFIKMMTGGNIGKQLVRVSAL